MKKAVLAIAAAMIMGAVIGFVLNGGNAKSEPVTEAAAEIVMTTEVPEETTSDFKGLEVESEFNIEIGEGQASAGG